MCGFVFSSSEKSKEIEKLESSFMKLVHRGPDHTEHRYLKDGSFIGFHRLAIMDQSHHGQQPFVDSSAYLVCNGEIYNFLILKEKLSEHSFESESDCEVILPYFKKYGLEALMADLDGEFAFVIHDEESGELIAARDPMGIRPLFYGYSKQDSKICFASEVKALHEICDEIKPFPPAHYYKDGEFFSYYQYDRQGVVSDDDVITEKIHDLLSEGVKKRLQSDAPIGFLLSGGLDSSLVCAIAAKYLDKPITTFSVGITENPIDTKYAKIVADHIGSKHHEVLFTKEETIEHLRELIYHLETWDITTIRASIGMSLICKYIKNNTDIKVVLTGEVSDEIFGYKYTDFAPSPLAFQQEAQKRVDELYLYDVLRADRCISFHSLEARVPFSDKDFVSYVMSLSPEHKVNTTGVGKYLLRKSFDNGEYLPDEILYRDKAAFSDAVGHSMVDWLKEYAESQYTEEEFIKKKEKFSHGMPFTKESLLYREIFEEFYPERSKLIPDFWMPNKEWENCDVDDPSARVLPNYGKSGE